jgi:hypothetical protein
LENSFLLFENFQPQQRVFQQNRPFAAIGHHLKMLQRDTSLPPFVHIAAFCRLNRRSAAEATGPAGFAEVRNGLSIQTIAA